MKREKNKQTISKEPIETPVLHLIGNKMSDNLFHILAHTPLPVQGIERSGQKIIICLSGHDFQVKEYELISSGLTVRNDDEGIENVQGLLDKNPEAVVLVSQIAKKHFDRETALDIYKSRIFCLLNRKSGITNKLTHHQGKIKQVRIRG